MRTDTTSTRIYIAGDAIDIWENPQARFSWTPTAIEGYMHTEQWESLFNALVLVGDSDPRGAA
jgi:hypothetical protein